VRGGGWIVRPGYSAVRGIPARRGRDLPKPVTLPLDPAERAFLLHRLRDIAATTEAITHHKMWGREGFRWERGQVTEHVADLVAILRGDPNRPLLIFGTLSRLILVEAIEGNTYFSAMFDEDPRLCPRAIGLADALRVKLVNTLGRKIAPVPLGRDRRRPSVQRGK
jgi:hypothetical protein